jgi:hypothetical protein
MHDASRTLSIAEILACNTPSGSVAFPVCHSSISKAVAGEEMISERQVVANRKNIVSR